MSRVDRGAYVEVDVAELYTDDDPSKVVLDVREPMETAQGTVEGSLCVPLGRLDEAFDQIPDDANLYVVCRSGSRSAYASEILARAGKRDVKNVAGRFDRLGRAGLPAGALRCRPAPAGASPRAGMYKVRQ
jgi:phage shock protein E